jgi:hypothetical protein
MLASALFLPSDGLMSGLTAGLTFTGMLHSGVFATSPISPEHCADGREGGHVGRQCGSCVKNGDDRHKVLRIHLVGTFRWGGMDARGGCGCPPRNPQVTMRPRSMVSQVRASGGSPAQKRGQRSPQIGRSTLSESNMGRRRGAMSRCVP